MSEQQTMVFGLEAHAEAEVVRGCCGQVHEFGECPNQNTNESEEDLS